jgi:predicted dehydrogenase
VNDSGIDAVYVATPVSLHAPITTAAAAAGKHVLCEKPMALTLEECDQMIVACRECGVRLGIAYYRRYYPLVGRIRALLHDGSLGKPVLAQVSAFERFDPPPGSPRSWLLDPALAGGGPMFDFGCHRIELMLHLLGPVTGAWGEIGSDILSRRVEDTAAAVLRFENGARALISVTHAVAESRDSLAIYCTAGSVHVPVLNRDRLVIRTPGGEQAEHHPPPPNFHAPLVEDFTAAVLAGRDPDISGEAGREVNRLLQLIYHASP